MAYVVTASNGTSIRTHSLSEAMHWEREAIRNGLRCRLSFCIRQDSRC